MSLTQVQASLAIEGFELQDEEIKLLKDYEQEQINFEELKNIVLEGLKSDKVA